MTPIAKSSAQIVHRSRYGRSSEQPRLAFAYLPEKAQSKPRYKAQLQLNITNTDIGEYEVCTEYRIYLNINFYLALGELNVGGSSYLYVLVPRH